MLIDFRGKGTWFTPSLIKLRGACRNHWPNSEAPAAITDQTQRGLPQSPAKLRGNFCNFRFVWPLRRRRAASRRTPPGRLFDDAGDPARGNAERLERIAAGC